MVKKSTDKKLNISQITDAYSDTWTALEAYDNGVFPPTKGIRKKSVFTSEELTQILQEFKQNLLARKQVTELFGTSRNNETLERIVGSIFQSAGGEDVYPTIEKKAAHLLYFMVKDHPFIDGNKRCGTFAFIWFLQKSNVDISSITSQSMTDITLTVAESKPKDKGKIIGSIVIMLQNASLRSLLKQITDLSKELQVS